MPVPKVGRIISSIRIRRGYSQEYVAFNMDISQKTLSRIEQDGDSLSLSRLKKISDLLNFDLLSLISFYIKENNIEDIDTISNLIDRTCHQSCNVDSCPYEKIIHRLEAEIEILKKELKYMEDNGKK